MDRVPQPRGALAALVDASPGEGKGGSGGLVWVVCTHLSHKLCSEEQRSQARQLLAWASGLAGEGGPAVLLCGDMNSPPLVPWSSYRAITTDHSSAARWHDLWWGSGPWFFQSTFPSSFASPLCGVRIDHMFALESRAHAAIKCKSMRVLASSEDAFASDHCAALADLEVQLRGAPRLAA